MHHHRPGSRRHLATLLARVALGLLVPLALAAQPAPEGAAATATDSADAKPDAKLGVVTVTAERRAEDPQKYAGTAQVLGQDDLRALGINNELRNLQVAVPGMSIANQEGNVEIFIRGIGSSNNTELGDPADAPYLNGNYIARPRGMGMLFFDLEGVEVNKGPQGTLRGRNALGGSLNIQTKKPDLDAPTSGYVQAEYANRDSTGAEGAINMPLSETSALRFSGYNVDKGSSFNNVSEGDQAKGLRPAGIQEETAGRLSFLSKPNDAFSIFVMGDYGHEGGTGYPGANIYAASKAGYMPDDLELRDVAYRGNEGQLKNTIWGLQTTIDANFNAFKFQYNGSYRSVHFDQRNASNDGIAYPGRDLSPKLDINDPSGEDYDVFSSVYWQTRSKAQTHEFLFFSPDDSRLRWTAGAFYFHEKQKSGFFSLIDKGYCCYSGSEYTMPKVDSKSWAGFADATFSVTDNFRLKGGIRYTDESKYRYGIGGNWALTLGGDGYSCCFATRLGTEGFVPALINRPNFDVSKIKTTADMARFLLQGVTTPGARDTLFGQLAGVLDGSRPNGTCVVRPDTINYGISCPLDGQHSFLNLTIPGQQLGRTSDNFFDWRFGGEYDLTAKNLLYATVTTAHKAGGFNDNINSTDVPLTFKPESLIALEVGSKNEFEFAGKTATFNVAGFYYRYTDQVLQDLIALGKNMDGTASGYTLVNRNIGKSRILGVEAESTLLLPYNFRLTFNGVALNTRIDKGTVGDSRSQSYDTGLNGVTSQIDLSGNRLPLASKFTFNTRIGQYWDLGGGAFDWQALFSFRSGYFLSQYNERDVQFLKLADDGKTIVNGATQTAIQAGFPDWQRARWTINLGAGYTFANNKWRVEGWVSNLLNTEVSQKAIVGSGLDVRFLNDARTYGIRGRYTF